MAAATPIILPSTVFHPEGFRPHDFPNQISEVWDSASLSLSEDTLIAITRDAFCEDIDPSNLVELHLSKTIRVQPSSATTMWLKSTNATDKQPIEVQYLDDGYFLHTAIFMLNGTTPVELPPMRRVLQITNISSSDVGVYLTSLGITGFNLTTTLGAISIYYGAGTGLPTENTTLQYFASSYVADANMAIGKSMDSSFTVPEGFTAYAFGFELVNGDNDEVFISIETRAPGGPWISRVSLNLFSNIFSRQSKVRAIPERWDVRVLAKGSGVAADVPVAMNYQLILIKDSAHVHL